MMATPDFPVTPAIRLLREHNIVFESHVYMYVEHGGTKASAEALGADEHAIIKTLVMETEGRRPLIVLMHGDCEVSTKQLARHMGVKSVKPCDPATALKHTGYQVGGTSPFGTRTAIPIFAEHSIFELSRIYINGGKRGFLISLDPKLLKQILPLSEVDVKICEG